MEECMGYLVGVGPTSTAQYEYQVDADVWDGESR